MKKLNAFLCTMLLILSFSGVSIAATYSFQPADPDLGDLDHSYYYTWEIDDLNLSAGETITGASLFFNDIRNWDQYYNHLWVHLLDSTESHIGYDTSGWADFFLTQGELLKKYVYLPNWAQDITYNFDADDLTILNLYYASNEDFGFGFDPDCHFFNNGITFNLETAQVPVPEPATMALFGIGLAGLAGIRRKLK